jgi:hypothetical protein
MAITLRQESQAGATTKGSALSFAELDNNFIHFLTNGITVVGDDSTGKEITLGNSIKFNGGDNVTVTVDEDSSAQGATVVNIAAGGGDVVTDTTPQLGGDLDVNSNKIVSVSNGNIILAPNGSGTVQVEDSRLEIYDDVSAVDYGNYGDFPLKIYDNGTGAQFELGQYLNGPAVSGAGANIQYVGLNFDTSGTYSVQDSTATQGDVGMFFGFNFDTIENLFYSGGGPMEFNAYGTSTNSYALQPITFVGSECKFSSELTFQKTYKETITTLTDDSSVSITIDCSATSVSTFSLNDAKDFVFTNLATGRSHTLIITNQGTHTATFSNSDSTAVKFPGGAPTVTSGAGKIDVITVFNDGTNLLGNIAQDFS